jgi:hypothetical protein
MTWLAMNINNILLIKRFVALGKIMQTIVVQSKLYVKSILYTILCACAHHKSCAKAEVLYRPNSRRAPQYQEGDTQRLRATLNYAGTYTALP